EGIAAEARYEVDTGELLIGTIRLRLHCGLHHLQPAREPLPNCLPLVAGDGQAQVALAECCVQPTHRLGACLRIVRLACAVTETDAGFIAAISPLIDRPLVLPALCHWACPFGGRTRDHLVGVAPHQRSPVRSE